MRKLLFTTTFALLAVTLLGQTEKAGYKTVAGRFEYLYNLEKFDSVFALFSNEMKTALPVNKTKDFLSGLKTQAGKISKMQFVKYENGTYARYKTNFERALLAVNISIDNDSKINGLFIKPYVEENLPVIERNLTKISLPFLGEWTVVWGGDTKELNYHIDNPAQKNAFDFIITDSKGSSYKTDGKTNEDYYAFGKELIAPCDGEVVLVVDGVKDNKPGEMDPIWVPGNTVIIRTINNEFVFLAHFKKHSIVVKEGQKVNKGTILGQCGNSGNSSEPHLHFHLQNVEDMNVATGIKCYFDNLSVNGQSKSDYSPVKKEKLSKQ